MVQALSDCELLSETKRLVVQERGILADILRHLREVDRRRLYSDLKYASLFDYATGELGYAEDQAYRRINAMRLINEVPNIEKKIVDGSLTLSNIGLATSLFRAERKAHGHVNKEKKIEVLKAIENKSRRQAQEIVQKMAGVPIEVLRPETVRPLSEEHVEFRFTGPRSLERKINRIKGILAHQPGGISTAELFEKFCDEYLEKHDVKLAKDGTVPARSESSASDNVAPAVLRRGLPSAVKRFVWRRDKGKCKNCGSVHALEIDHIIPFANGGTGDPENLRLLCRNCNQRSAIKSFGVEKMDRFLAGPDC